MFYIYLIHNIYNIKVTVSIAVHFCISIVLIFFRSNFYMWIYWQFKRNHTEKTLSVTVTEYMTKNSEYISMFFKCELSDWVNIAIIKTRILIFYLMNISVYQFSWNRNDLYRFFVTFFQIYYQSINARTNFLMNSI